MFFKLIFVRVSLLYDVLLVSAVHQSERVVHMHVAPLLGFPPRLGHHRALGRIPHAAW